MDAADPPPDFTPFSGDAAAATYFVTVCVNDALPNDVLRELVALKRSGRPAREVTREGVSLIERTLDAGHGECPLRREVAVDAVMRGLTKYHHTRYRLHAAVVMPNHVHMLLRPDGPVEAVVRRIHSSTAKRVCDVIHTAVPLWRDLVIHRPVRNADHLRRSLDYLGRNADRLPGDPDAVRWLRGDWERCGWCFPKSVAE